MTSLDGETIEVFPVQKWAELSAVPEEKLKEQRVRKFLLKANLNGTRTTIDKRGRIPVPKWLKNKTGLEGEIAVEAAGNRLVLKKKNHVS